MMVLEEGVELLNPIENTQVIDRLRAQKCQKRQKSRPVVHNWYTAVLTIRVA